jgi:hypothetical protein
VGGQWSGTAQSLLNCLSAPARIYRAHSFDHSPAQVGPDGGYPPSPKTWIVNPNDAGGAGEYTSSKVDKHGHQGPDVPVDQMWLGTDQTFKAPRALCDLTYKVCSVDVLSFTASLPLTPSRLLLHVGRVLTRAPPRHRTSSRLHAGGPSHTLYTLSYTLSHAGGPRPT